MCFKLRTYYLEYIHTIAQRLLPFENHFKNVNVLNTNIPSSLQFYITYTKLLYKHLEYFYCIKELALSKENLIFHNVYCSEDLQYFQHSEAHKPHCKAQNLDEVFNLILSHTLLNRCSVILTDLKNCVHNFARQKFQYEKH